MYRSIFILCLTIATGLHAQPNENITFVSETLVTGSYEDVKVVGDRLFCANRYGVVIYDLANWDPAEPPAEFARFPTTGSAYGLFIEDTLCYVADGGGGLAIYDITDLQRVIELGRISNIRPATAVTVSNGTAFVLAHRTALFAIDVRNPRNPRRLSVIDQRSEQRTLIVRDTLLWMASYAFVQGRGGYDFLTCIDISNPRNMRQIGQYLDRWTVNFTIEGDVAFIGAGILYSIDISDPQDMRLLDTLVVIDQGVYFGMSGYLYDDGKLYGDVGKLSIADVQNPRDLRALSYLVHDDISGYKLLAIYQDHLIAAAFQWGLKIVDVSDPSEPRIEHFNFHTGEPMDVAMRGDYLYVADRLSGICSHRCDQNGRFRVFSIADIHHPRQVAERDSFQGQLDLGMHRVVLRDTLAYLSAGRLYIFSISNPENPTLIYPNDGNRRAGFGYQARFHGDYLINAGAIEIDIISVADPRNPVFIYFANPRNVLHWGVVVTDNFLFVPTSIINGNFELWVYDWSNPRDVYRVGEPCDLPRHLEWGLIRGDYLYLVAGDHFFYGLSVVSVEDPLRPRLVYSTDEVRYGSDIKLFGEYLFIADGDDGVRIFSLENPEHPTQVGYYDTPGVAQKLDVDPERGFMAVADQNNLSIYDVGELLGVWDLTSSAAEHDFGAVMLDSGYFWDLILTNQAERNAIIDSIKIRGEGFDCEIEQGLELEPGQETAARLIFSPDSIKSYSGELSIYSQERELKVGLSGEGAPLSVQDNIVIPKIFALLPAYPNPFNSLTSLRFSLPHAVKVRLCIYDITGREVIRLIDNPLEAGYHSVEWDGSGSGRIPVAAGLYFTRIEAGSFTKTLKLILVK